METVTRFVRESGVAAESVRAYRDTHLAVTRSWKDWDSRSRWGGAWVKSGAQCQRGGWDSGAEKLRRLEALLAGVVRENGELWRKVAVLEAGIAVLQQEIADLRSADVGAAPWRSE